MVNQYRPKEDTDFWQDEAQGSRRDLDQAPIKEQREDTLDQEEGEDEQRYGPSQDQGSPCQRS